MDRRELLKFLPMAAVTPSMIKPGIAGYEVSKGKFLIFVNTQAVEMESFDSAEGFPCEALIIPVRLTSWQSMSDVVAIYNVDENSINAEIKQPMEVKEPDGN